MPENDPQNLNFYWSTTLVRALYQQGIHEVVISPGSRSTPLTLAFASHPGFRKHVAIDERSAAFLALGLSKGSGVPACLVCTSGTAVANYYPAVIEATQSDVPILILSADRPPKLRGIGASQTIDQLKIFGDYPVFFHEVGEPKSDRESLHRLELAAEQSVKMAIDKSGVSHLNLPFNKPFEPTAEYLEQVEGENAKLAKKNPSALKSLWAKIGLSKPITEQISKAEKPVLIAGCSLSAELAESVSELAKVLNAPLITEPGSNIPSTKHTITGFDGFLRSKHVMDELKPDLILRFGRDPVSKALSNYLIHHAKVPQLRFYSGEFPTDETLTAQTFMQILGGLSFNGLESVSENKEWIRSWRRYQKDFAAFRESQMFPSTPLTDGYVFHHLTDLIPKNAFTMLSNSFPVRDMSLFGEYDGKEIYTNRGTAGIDGIISTTIGLSHSLEKPGVLFIGDIAFLHDSNALLSLNKVNAPLLIFVLNNGGGTIFKMLPVNQFKRKFIDYFETPQHVSLGALCRAHKISHTLITRPEQVISSFEANIERPKVHIFECITDGEESMALRKTLWNFSPEVK